MIGHDAEMFCIESSYQMLKKKKKIGVNEMLRSFKNRTVNERQPVACFWNLHEDNFSIEGKYFEREKSRKLILAHGNGIFLKNATFTVNEKKRQQVLREKRKNVHAYVKGEFVCADERIDSVTLAVMKQAYYNPYKQDCFTDKETGEKIENAEFVILIDKKVYYK